MLNLYTTKRLSKILNISESRLHDVADRTHDFVTLKTLYDPSRPDRPRDVISVGGDWRTIQSRLHKRILQPRLSPSDISHGAVRGRSAKSNVLAHKSNNFIYVADISNFFPTISNQRIFGLYRSLGCSPTVARLLTKLCTYDYHLALGLVTSPILSDQVLKDVDARLVGLCGSFSPPLICTRFVDDIAVSSRCDLSETSVARIISRAMTEHGFQLNHKSGYGRFDEGMSITKLRLRSGKPDVTAKFIHELDRLLQDHLALSNDQPFCGPLLTSATLEGKMRHAIRINPGRGLRLWRKFRSIRWDKVCWNAKSLNLHPASKTLVPRGAPPVDFGKAYSDSATRPSDHDPWIAPVPDDTAPF